MNVSSDFVNSCCSVTATFLVIFAKNGCHDHFFVCHHFNYRNRCNDATMLGKLIARESNGEVVL